MINIVMVSISVTFETISLRHIKESPDWLTTISLVHNVHKFSVKASHDAQVYQLMFE